MQTPPQSPPRRQAPGAPRQQRRGMRTPVRQRIQRRVPGAPQRQRQAPREDGDERRRNDEENKQCRKEEKGKIPRKREKCKKDMMMKWAVKLAWVLRPF